MVDFCFIKAFHSRGGVVYHRTQICLDIAYLCPVPLETEQHVFDMSRINLKNSVFYQFCGNIIAGNADNGGSTAQHFKHILDDFVYLLLVGRVSFGDNLILDIAVDKLLVLRVCIYLINLIRAVFADRLIG